MKLSRHNGRSGKNGAYNVKHNDRRFDVQKSEHIDAERTRQNIYWDCYRGYYSEALIPRNDDVLPASFSEVEQKFYWERYSDFCEAQNARNEKTRHTERNRSPEDLLKDKRTCPEESIMQIGNMDEHTSPDVLQRLPKNTLTSLTKDSESIFTFWIGRCIWTKPRPISMNAMSLIAKTNMGRLHRSRKRLWSFWECPCLISKNRKES